MALEQLTNAGNTTTTGSVNNTSNPVVVAVTSASEFPATGNFRIKIDDEILLVTSVSGLNFTASRAQEGTTIATHSSGANVAFVVTKESFRAVVAQYDLYDTFANRPAAGTVGRRFTPSDWEGVSYYDDGTNWKIVLPTGQMLPEFTSDGLSTTVNSTSSTYAAVQGFMRWLDTTAGALRIRYKTTSAVTSLQVTMCCRLNCAHRDQVIFGPYFGQSSNDHGYFVGLDRDTTSFNYVHFYYSNLSTFGANDLNLAAAERDEIIWMRSKFTFSGGLYEFFTSRDGTNFVKHSQTTNVNVTAPNRIGFVFDRFGQIFTGNNINLDIYALNLVEV